MGSSPAKYLVLYAKVFLVISTIDSTADSGWISDSGLFLNNWEKISFSVKSQVL